MHTEPSRTSPSFEQVPGKCQSRRDRSKASWTQGVQHDEAVMQAPVKPPPIRKKPKPGSSTPARIKPPPLPPAPKLPNNWLALSAPKVDPVAAPAPPPTPPPDPVEVPMDDWNLIRTSDGKVGWVLTRPLSMAIPDEVAQYAEGHRITSYFPLGQVRDGDSVKSNWLWTTITKGGQPYEFDSFRVFVWSLKHHRYETAYIERNVAGHYPVCVTNAGSTPSFSRGDRSRRRAPVSKNLFVRQLSNSHGQQGRLDDQGSMRDAAKLASNAAPAGQNQKPSLDGTRS